MALQPSRMSMAPAIGALSAASSITQPSALLSASSTNVVPAPAAAPLLQTAAKVLAVTAPPPVQFVQTTSLPPNSIKAGDLLSTAIVTSSPVHPASPDSPPRKGWRHHHGAGKHNPTPFSDVRLKLSPAIDLSVA